MELLNLPAEILALIITDAGPMMARILTYTHKIFQIPECNYTSRKYMTSDAAKENDFIVYQFLIETGHKHKRMAEYHFASHGNMAALKYLNDREMITSQTTEAAIYRGNVEILELYRRDHYVFSKLSEDIADYAPIIKWIKENNYEIYNNKLFNSATRHNNLRLFCAIVDSGKKIPVFQCEYAANHSSTEILKYLLKNGHGCGYIKFVSYNCREEIINILLDHGLVGVNNLQKYIVQTNNIDLLERAESLGYSFENCMHYVCEEIMFDYLVNLGYIPTEKTLQRAIDNACEHICEQCVRILGPYVHNDHDIIQLALDSSIPIMKMIIKQMPHDYIHIIFNSDRDLKIPKLEYLHTLGRINNDIFNFVNDIKTIDWLISNNYFPDVNGVFNDIFGKDVKIVAHYIKLGIVDSAKLFYASIITNNCENATYLLENYDIPKDISVYSTSKNISKLLNEHGFTHSEWSIITCIHYRNYDHLRIILAGKYIMVPHIGILISDKSYIADIFREFLGNDFAAKV